MQRKVTDVKAAVATAVEALTAAGVVDPAPAPAPAREEEDPADVRRVRRRKGRGIQFFAKKPWSEISAESKFRNI